MFSTSDTIVAIATPPGRGGIGVVRLSGPHAHAIARKLIAREAALEPRRATFALILPESDKVVPEPDTTREPAVDVPNRGRSNALDEVVVTYFPAPASYTGDDVVEVGAHGSPVVLQAIVTAAVDAGARRAEPGEFTLRAFLNGRLDLMQAEAVADLIDAVTPLQARAAFDQLQGTLTCAIGAIDAALFDLIARLEASVDFPEEGYHFVDASELVVRIDSLVARAGSLVAEGRRGRLVREGLQIAIVGAPNVGKSSVFNALVGSGRAIVTDVPGTTRDLVTEIIDLDGLRVTLVDTAGLRDTSDTIEAQGVERARQAQAVADLVLVVLDRSLPLDNRTEALQCYVNKRLIVANKIDLPAAWRRSDAVEISALTGEGMSTLRTRIARVLDADPLVDRPTITNARHIALVQRALDALVRAASAAGAGGEALSEEFVLADLQDARSALEEVTGRRAPEELLDHIFSRFCVGK